MAAALITPVDWNYLHSAPKITRVLKVTQSDWIYLDEPGAFAPKLNNYIGTVGTITYGTGTIFNAGTAYSATDTSIAVVGVPVGIYASARYPFYIETTAGELIQVQGASSTTATSATWSLVRGCLGTTASATGLTHGSTVYIKNCLTLTDAGTGYVYIEYTPMPEEPKAQLFA